jgi:hypothetical protein
MFLNAKRQKVPYSSEALTEFNAVINVHAKILKPRNKADEALEWSELWDKTSKVVNFWTHPSVRPLLVS